jgi:hypothetical protein
VGEIGPLTDHPSADATPDQHRDAGRAVIGSARAVLLGPAPELRPHVHEHSVGEAAGLEVGLEGCDRLGRQRDPGVEGADLAGVGVELRVGGQGHAAQREAAGQHRGQPRQAL